MIDSYEVQVRCLDGEGAVVGVFGREGEGPGEFDNPSYLARGDEGTVGVMDLGLSRFTVFGDTGDATVLRAPMYVPEVPDEQEVAQREEELKAFNRGTGRHLPPDPDAFPLRP